MPVSSSPHSAPEKFHAVDTQHTRAKGGQRINPQYPGLMIIGSGFAPNIKDAFGVPSWMGYQEVLRNSLSRSVSFGVCSLQLSCPIGISESGLGNSLRPISSLSTESSPLIV